jgi:hypothetical protein
MAVAASAPIPQAIAPGPPPAAGGPDRDGYSGFSFHDLVSIVNPLQHFPIVSTLYRKFTGDTIKPLEHIAGDTLYGGWMGLVSSVANLVFEKSTGKDFGDTVLAFLDGDKDAAPTPFEAPVQPASIAANVSLRTDVTSDDSNPSATSIADASVASGFGQRAIQAYRRSTETSATPIDLMPPL